MLYQWDPQTQELRSTNTNRLDLFAEGDRETVEEFLIALKEPLAELEEMDAEAGQKQMEEFRRRRQS